METFQRDKLINRMKKRKAKDSDLHLGLLSSGVLSLSKAKAKEPNQFKIIVKAEKSWRGR